MQASMIFVFPSTLWHNKFTVVIYLMTLIMHSKVINFQVKMLEIELTESSLLDKSDHVIELLEKVKERHISISLDDFGTGYSSLAYLTNYPIDTLKIDKAFINRIGKEKDEAIINAIIVLGQTIGMTLVAEGVETIEQIEFLKNRGCYIFQGFYYSKPLTAVQSTQYLEQNKLIANLS